MRQSHNEKVRKITVERDQLKKKCEELEQASKGITASPKDTVKPKVGHSAISQFEFKKSQADLRRAEAENETLRNQLQKAQLAASKNQVIDRPKGKDVTGKPNFLGTARESIKRTPSPNVTRKSEKYPEEGVNFSFGGKESQEGAAAPAHSNQELQSQNAQLRAMVTQLTETIN